MCLDEKKVNENKFYKEIISLKEKMGFDFLSTKGFFYRRIIILIREFLAE